MPTRRLGDLQVGAPAVIAVPGASRPETILDSLAAAGLRLSGDDLTRLGRV